MIVPTNGADRPFMSMYSSREGHYSDLSGRFMSNDEFKHNNMLPFYGSRIKQNTSDCENGRMLESYTGYSSSAVGQNKKETASMYDMSVPKPITDDTVQFMNERTYRSNTQKGIFPLQQIRVGPGLNDGYTAAPSGGFHQAATRDAIMPRTLEQLRAGSNVKTTTSTIPIMGMGPIQRAETIAPPTTTKIVEDQGCARMVPNRASVTRDVPKGSIECREVNRGAKTAYTFTPAGRSNTQYHVDTQLTHKRSDCSGPVPVGSAVSSVTKMVNNVCVNMSMREDPCPQERPGAITSFVKALVTPIVDALKTTKKELFVLPMRENGDNFKPQIPAKAQLGTVDVPRTTIKETLIHDTRIAACTPINKAVYVYDPAQVARTTIRETTGQVQSANLKGPSKGKLSPTDKAKVTIKETTITVGRKGGAVAGGIGGYTTASVEPGKMTAREITEQNEYVGQANIGRGDGYLVTEVTPTTDVTQYTEYFGTCTGEAAHGVFTGEMQDQNDMTVSGREPAHRGSVQGAQRDMTFGKVPLENNFGFETRNIDNIHHMIGDNVAVGMCPSGKNDGMLNDRNDPRIMDALKDNPYTQPGTSMCVSNEVCGI